jgi:hypothetical protein
MKNRYVYHSPRGFANEFAIYRVSEEHRELAERWLSREANDVNVDAHWITRRDADRLTARQRANARDGRNIHTNPVGATEISDWWQEVGLALSQNETFLTQQKEYDHMMNEDFKLATDTSDWAEFERVYGFRGHV